MLGRGARRRGQGELIAPNNVAMEGARGKAGVRRGGMWKKWRKAKG